MNVKILEAELKDAEEILVIQKMAYKKEADRYNDNSISPLTQTLSELQGEFRSKTILKATLENSIVGTVRAYEENGTCNIGRLAVHPNFQSKGIGTALMRSIESRFAPRRYELFTGSRSDENIRLYKKLGYRIFKHDRYECGNIGVVYMEKVIHTAEPVAAPDANSGGR